MLFILYSETNAQNVNERLSLAEYSYYFVYKGYRKVLEKLGEIITVDDPGKVDPIYHKAKSENKDCLFFSFSPPNRTPLGLDCPTIPVIAWEFDSLPEAKLGMSGDEDWVKVLKDCGQALSLSNHTRRVIQKRMGKNYLVDAIPTPINDSFVKTEPPSKRALKVDGIVIDSRQYDFTELSNNPTHLFTAHDTPGWEGGVYELSIAKQDDFTPNICGFYGQEMWGAWSQLSTAWVLLPFQFSGEIALTLEHRAFGKNIGKTIQVSLGDQVQDLKLKAGRNLKTTLNFSLPEAVSTVKLSGIHARPLPNFPDQRSMGIGLYGLSIDGPETASPTQSLLRPPKVINFAKDEVIYTSVLTPKCGRKNWLDLITAFILAFKDNPKATLIIKVSSQGISDYFSELHEIVPKLQPFDCRFILIDGFLDDESYNALIGQTNFYANSSRSEGLCLPLIEYMSSRKPAIAPCHTAMEDYVTADGCFVVDTSEELTIWPHDVNQKYTAMRHRVNWQSLKDAFSESYSVFKENPSLYKNMAEQAELSVKQFSGMSHVKDQLENFIQAVISRAK